MPKEYDMMQWHTQEGCIATNIKVKIDFTLPELSATRTLMQNFHVDDSTEGIYYVILGRDILEALGLNLKLFDHFIESDG